MNRPFFGGVRRIERFLRTPKVCLAFPVSGEGGPSRGDETKGERLLQSPKTVDEVPIFRAKRPALAGWSFYQQFTVTQ